VRGPGEILLLSTYELGHRPHGLALPLAFLEAAGFAPAVQDLSLDALDEEAVRRARLVLLCVPMHTALVLAVQAAAWVRELNPEARLGFHGLYAPLNSRRLVALGADAVLGGECEERLVALSEAIERGEPLREFVEEGGPAATRRKLDFPVPSGAGLPAPSRYAKLVTAAGEERVAGYTEASRGCLHLCRHCPIPPVYQGRFFVVPVETVLEDVARQVGAGATHMTFGDPDFLNGPTHALGLVRAVNARFPSLTFDFTAKVEHLLAHAALLPEFARRGALFVTSALESLSELVLLRLEKGHTREDALAAMRLCDEAGLALRPSFVAFTPWTTLADWLEVAETFEREGWLHQLDPVQLSIRLLVPPGSRLLELEDLVLDRLDETAFTWRWTHPDPRMDALQKKLAARAEEGARTGEDSIATIAAMKALGLKAAGRPLPRGRQPHLHHRRAARLSESWFC
jgi:radical SAM superfamily enzyme YgiQ (UPF0313 family)